jgi:hypothetical protein
MYNFKQNYIAVEIPGNASKSLVKAATDVHGAQAMACYGHHTLVSMVESLIPTQVSKHSLFAGVEAFAVIRSPADRLYSLLCKASREKVDVSLDDLMKEAWEQRQRMFTPQFKFVELPTKGDKVNLRMWDMARIDAAAHCMTGRLIRDSTEDVPAAPRENVNPGHSKITVEGMMNHRVYDHLMDSKEHYALDYHLWIRARRTNKHGK